MKLVRTGAALLAVALLSSGCAAFQKAEAVFGMVSDAAATTVPPDVARAALNTFNILKASATNYGTYCIQQAMAPSVCSAGNRRIVVKAVRAGTSARNAVEADINSGANVPVTLYNALTAAISSLQASPAQQFNQ